MKRILTLGFALFTLSAAGEEVISLRANTDLTYGMRAYILGHSLSVDDFNSSKIYRVKDHCWFWGSVELFKMGTVNRGEELIVVPQGPANRPERHDYKVMRKDGVQFAGLSCMARVNPAPESLDDKKSFLQIVFGAAATIF